MQVRTPLLLPSRRARQAERTRPQPRTPELTLSSPPPRTRSPARTKRVLGARLRLLQKRLSKADLDAEVPKLIGAANVPMHELFLRKMYALVTHQAEQRTRGQSHPATPHRITRITRGTRSTRSTRTRPRPIPSPSQAQAQAKLEPGAARVQAEAKPLPQASAAA